MPGADSQLGRGDDVERHRGTSSDHETSRFRTYCRRRRHCSSAGLPVEPARGSATRCPEHRLPGPGVRGSGCSPRPTRSSSPVASTDSDMNAKTGSSRRTWPRRVDRGTLFGSRPAAARPDSGGRPRPDPVPDQEYSTGSDGSGSRPTPAWWIRQAIIRALSGQGQDDPATSAHDDRCVRVHASSPTAAAREQAASREHEHRHARSSYRRSGSRPR